MKVTKQSKMRLWNTFVLSITVIFLLNSCYKEELNGVPRINDITISSKMVKPGETVELNMDAFDPDGDPLYIKLNSSNGQVVSAPGELPILFIPPYIEGANMLDFEISDGKITTKASAEINVYSYLYDGFSRQDKLWGTSNCKISYNQGEVLVESTDTIRDAIYYFDLHDNVEPPYAVHMDLTLTGDVSGLTYKDKYGIYLNFRNVGADTLIKAMWFRVYPFSSVKNWKISAYADQGNSSRWVNLEANSYGVSPFISIQNNIINSLKMVVEANNTITIYSNGQAVYSNKDWAAQYLSGSKTPKLILEQVGARTSGGSIKVDNVFVSKKTNLETASIF